MTDQHDLSPEAKDRVKAERKLVADIQAQCAELDQEAQMQGYRSHVAADLLRRLLSDRIRDQHALTASEARAERAEAAAAKARKKALREAARTASRAHMEPLGFGWPSLPEYCVAKKAERRILALLYSGEERDDG